jgi:hypothetical protein
MNDYVDDRADYYQITRILQVYFCASLTEPVPAGGLNIFSGF